MSTARDQRGISLIEAVVALAVMAFGMLAYAGLQNSLRFNGDVAKQRSEAVRIAQEQVEQWRAFSVIETTEDRTAYNDLRNPTEDDPIPPIEGDNATYTLTRTVVDAASDPSAPRMKTLVVEVEWVDRNGDRQRVRLSTAIAASPPELAGTLAVPGASGPPQLPQGRNPAIPLAAKDLGNGTSAFKPPGSGGGTTVWVFDNLTGVIVGVCNTITTGQASLTAADVQSCSNNANGLPLSGFVRFATDIDTTTGLPRAPTTADAENPASTALNLAVSLTLTSTGHPSPSHACFAEAPATALTTSKVVRYFCAVFFELGAVPLWSGISELTPLAFAEPDDSVPWTIAVDAADPTSTHYRVCRYTPATSDAQSIPNQLHPRNYSNVSAIEPLTNQNFLVIHAGDGSVAFQCPTDVPANPALGDFVNRNTLLHQPPPTAP